MMDCTIKISSLDTPALSSMDLLPMLSTAKKKLIRMTPKGL